MPTSGVMRGALRELRAGRQSAQAPASPATRAARGSSRKALGHQRQRFRHTASAKKAPQPTIICRQAKANRIGLRKIDTLLENEAVIEVVAQALETRWPQSRRRGRPGTPAEVVIRMLILKHLFDWSYDDLEREVRANLVYRMFTRIDAGDVPDANTILKIAGALGPEVIEQLHRQVVEVAKRAGVTHGRRFRIDTAVVETNVHYPTDSTLLRDGVRVLTHTLQRANAALGDPKRRIRNRLRSVMRRVLIIGYQARSPKTRMAWVKSYRKLMATTRAVMRDRRSAPRVLFRADGRMSRLRNTSIVSADHNGRDAALHRARGLSPNCRVSPTLQRPAKPLRIGGLLPTPQVLVVIAGHADLPITSTLDQ
jgi:IS5 family transposase